MPNTWTRIQPVLYSPVCVNRARIFSPGKRAQKSEKTLCNLNGISARAEKRAWTCRYRRYFDSPEIFRAEISAQGRHITLLPPAGLDPFPPERGRIKLNFNFLFGLR